MRTVRAGGRVSSRGFWPVVMALAIAAGAAACGSGSGSTASQSSGGSSPGQGGGLTTLSVGVIPIIDVAPLYLGMKHGFFRDVGLRVVAKPAQGGSAIIPAVTSGNEQFGFSNNTSLIIASSKGLKVTAVTAGVNAGNKVRGRYAGMLVRAKSSIHSFAQLSGKTIAVNDLKNVGPLAINAAIEKGGGNYRSVKYVQISFPSMALPLRHGQVDALWEVEPFISVFAQKGDTFRFLGDPMVAAASMFPVSSYFTTAAYAKGHPKIVAAFRKAMNRSLTYAQSHPSAVRRIVSSYTRISPAAAKVVSLPTWTTNPEVHLLHTTATYAQQFGYIHQPPDWRVLLGGLGPSAGT